MYNLLTDKPGLPGRVDLFLFLTTLTLVAVRTIGLKVYMTQKNIFCLFEKPFKIQKNGVFLFKISFFVLEILTFFYYAN